MSWIAVAIAGGAVVGAAGSYLGASKQAAGAGAAAKVNSDMFSSISSNELPYLKAGNAAQNELSYLLGIQRTGSKDLSGTAADTGFGSLITPFNTSNWKSLSPMYDFVKQQGTQGVLNQASTGGSSMGGSALKDLMSFNSANANQSFTNAYNIYQNQNQSIFSRLAQIAGTGQAAGSNQAVGGSAFGANIGGALSNVGTAQGGGYVGGANAISGGMSNLGALAWLNANQQPPAESVGGTGF